MQDRWWIVVKKLYYYISLCKFGGRVPILNQRGSVLLEPDVVENFRDRDSLFGVLLQHLSQQVLKLKREVFREFYLLGCYLMLDVLESVAIKWNFTSHQLIDGYAKGPDIAFDPVLFREDFGRDVEGSTGDLHLVLVVLLGNGHTEVNKFDLTRSVVHNIGRLDVPVDNILLMAVVQGSHQLRDDFDQLRLGEDLILLLEVATLAELLADVNVLFVLVILKILHDVRVVYF